MRSHAGAWERGKYCGSDAFVATIEVTNVQYTQSDQTAPFPEIQSDKLCYASLKIFSGSHDPPWEPISWLPRQHWYASPRRSVGMRKKSCPFLYGFDQLCMAPLFLRPSFNKAPTSNWNRFLMAFPAYTFRTTSRSASNQSSISLPGSKPRFSALK